MSSFVSGFQECNLFWRTATTNAKNCFQKSDGITFIWLLGHCTAKNRDIGLKFCTLVVLFSSILCIPVFSISSKNNFAGIYFRKIEILTFGGRKQRNSKSKTAFFVKQPIWHLSAFLVAFCFKTLILQAIEWWPFFERKSRDMTPLKRKTPFSQKNFSTDFA